MVRNTTIAGIRAFVAAHAAAAAPLDTPKNLTPSAGRDISGALIILRNVALLSMFLATISTAMAQVVPRDRQRPIHQARTR